MYRRIPILGALLLALLAAAPGASVSPSALAQSETETTRVRVAHASPDAPAVDVLVDDAVAFANLPFESLSDYAELPAGSYNVKVVPTGATEPVVIEADLTLEAATDYTVAASGLLAEIEPVVYVDDNTLPEPGKSHLRVVHLSPDAPAVDIAVAGGPTLFESLAFQDASDYAAVDAGSYDVDLRLAGAQIVAFTIPDVVLEPGVVYTVFAMGQLADMSFTTLTSIDASTPEPARVRVAHASPDAPAVDVLVDDQVAFSNAAFGDISGYAELPAGTYTVKVVPTGATEPVVIEAELTLEAGMDYSVAAIGALADIAPLVLVDDNRQPAMGKAHVRFVHASPDAPAVDIAVAGGGPVLFSNVAFGEVGAYLPVDGGSYDLEVRVAGTDTVALDLPGVMLEAGTVYTVFAMGLVGGEPMLQAVPSVDAQYEDATPEPTGTARVRVAHASPDAPAVDVLVNDQVAFSNAPFGAISDYAELPAGTYTVKVVPTGATEPVVIEAELTLEADTDYTVAAIGPLAEIAPLVMIDDNRQPEAGKAHVRFVHASPDAPAVDIAVAGGGPVLFSNIAFGEVGAYLPVDAATYDLEVRVAGTETVALEVDGLSLREGNVYTVFAMGLVGGEPMLQAVPSVDYAPARVRVAHASPDAPAVDVLVNDQVAFSNAPFGAISDYAALPAGTYTVKVVPSGATEPVVIEAELTLEAGADYTVAAIGPLAEIAPLVLMDDNGRPAMGKAHVRFVHASPDAPAVDIAVADGGPVLFSNVAFGEIGAYLPVDGGSYDLEVRVAGTDTVALDLPGVMLEAGTVYTVFAMGLVGGEPMLQAVPSVDAVYPDVTPPMPSGGMIYLPALMKTF